MGQFRCHTSALTLALGRYRVRTALSTLGIVLAGVGGVA